ncbi:MAG: SDR family NAD(P)-dependent oxidoreductase, partial [Yoonia sp.]
MPVAVITGGNKGLGLSQSQRFVDAGYEVFVVARSRADIVQLGPHAHFVECDIAADRGAKY